MARALVVLSAWLLASALPAPAQVTTTEYRHGAVTFLQGESEITLVLRSGSTYEADTSSHWTGVALWYSPQGKPGVAPAFFLHLRKQEGPVFISALDVTGTPGNAYYDAAESQCVLTLVRMDAQGVEGAGSCDGPFEGGGLPVRSFRFTASR